MLIHIYIFLLFAQNKNNTNSKMEWYYFYPLLFLMGYIFINLRDKLVRVRLMKSHYKRCVSENCCPCKGDGKTKGKCLYKCNCDDPKCDEDVKDDEELSNADKVFEYNRKFTDIKSVRAKTNIEGIVYNSDNGNYEITESENKDEDDEDDDGNIDLTRSSDVNFARSSSSSSSIYSTLLNGTKKSTSSNGYMNSIIPSQLENGDGDSKIAISSTEVEGEKEGGKEGDSVIQIENVIEKLDYYNNFKSFVSSNDETISQYLSKQKITIPKFKPKSEYTKEEKANIYTHIMNNHGVNLYDISLASSFFCISDGTQKYGNYIPLVEDLFEKTIKGGKYGEFASIYIDGLQTKYRGWDDEKKQYVDTIYERLSSGAPGKYDGQYVNRMVSKNFYFLAISSYINQSGVVIPISLREYNRLNFILETESPNIPNYYKCLIIQLYTNIFENLNSIFTRSKESSMNETSLNTKTIKEYIDSNRNTKLFSYFNNIFEDKGIKEADLYSEETIESIIRFNNEVANQVDGDVDGDVDVVPFKKLWNKMWPGFDLTNGLNAGDTQNIGLLGDVWQWLDFSGVLGETAWLKAIATANYYKRFKSTKSVSGLITIFRTFMEGLGKMKHQHGGYISSPVVNGGVVRTSTENNISVHSGVKLWIGNYLKDTGVSIRTLSDVTRQKGSIPDYGFILNCFEIVENIERHMINVINIEEYQRDEKYCLYPSMENGDIKSVGVFFAEGIIGETPEVNILSSKTDKSLLSEGYGKRSGYKFPLDCQTWVISSFKPWKIIDIIRQSMESKYPSDQIDYFSLIYGPFNLIATAVENCGQFDSEGNLQGFRYNNLESSKGVISGEWSYGALLAIRTLREFYIGLSRNGILSDIKKYNSIDPHKSAKFIESMGLRVSSSLGDYDVSINNNGYWETIKTTLSYNALSLTHKLDEWYLSCYEYLESNILGFSGDEKLAYYASGTGETGYGWKANRILSAASSFYRDCLNQNVDPLSDNNVIFEWRSPEPEHMDIC